MVKTDAISYIVDWTYLARYSKQKNPLFIVEIIAELIKKNKDTHVTWCGDGELKEPILDAIKAAKIERHFSMIGYTDNVFPYLEKASYLLIPSLTEGLGLCTVRTRVG